MKYYLSNALYLFAYILILNNLKHSDVMIMFGIKDTKKRADLRKKTSIKDEIEYLNLDINTCMVPLAVFLVLLFSVLSVATAQNPYVI